MAATEAPPSKDTPLQKTVKSMLTEVLTFTWDSGVVPYNLDEAYSNDSKSLIDRSIADFMGRFRHEPRRRYL